jgi:hypothetical protein
MFTVPVKLLARRIKLYSRDGSFMQKRPDNGCVDPAGVDRLLKLA